MTQALSQLPLLQLQECLSLAQDVSTHAEAAQQYVQLRGRLSQESTSVELLDLIWKELLTARRSAAFWQEISEVEKHMTERLAQEHFQLQQNYLRLMQEQ